ncbi:hypothetical protein [Nocardia stercoris]|uniref:hypothetical protein n=1 Tax=Nocardia stercoris TaxID=2483361 RepID=UPI00131A3EBF|nr:hypothetical protein [Nocardia stercoris]
MWESSVLGSHGVLRGAIGAVHDLRGLQVATLVTGGNIDRRILDGYRIDPDAVG